MKRIIAVLICLCIILTGCHNKKNNPETNQTANDKAQNEITKAPDSGDTADSTDNMGNNTADNSSDNNSNNSTDSTSNDTANNTDNTDNTNNNGNTSTISKLLTLNKEWALIQTVELEQPDYKIPAYEADVKPYTIAKDLSNIENIDQFSGFTKEQMKMLVNNGFVVLPDTSGRIFYVYDDNEYKGIPNFVSADVALHLYHQFYDKSLMSIESNYLYQDLDQMTRQMLDKSIQLETQLTDEALKKLQKKNIAYFLVARMLLLQSEDVSVKVDSDVLDLAKQEYELAKAAEGITLSPLFNYDLDYSQFTVRGHYTRSEELGRFFKAMMWFGNVPLAFVDKDKNIIYDNVYQALLITFTTIANSEGTNDAKLWSDIYQPTSQYVGLSDDINVFTMNGLRSSVFGENEDPDIYNDESYQDKLTEAVKALPEPQIQGKITASSIPTGKQFRFMGQRYILDSEIMQKLMEPQLRPLPTALDVMGVFGNKTAEDLLFKVYKPQDSWPEYTGIYKSLKDKVEGLDAGYWDTNLYTGWLGAIRSALTEYDKKSGMPFFMTTEAWRKKSLNTALASYTELKHDSVLYGKQPMAEMGGPDATAAQQYVEPNVELYYRLLYLTDFTCSVLEEKGMLNDNLKEGADKYKTFLNLLIRCSMKELINRPLNEEEIRQLLWCGGTIENISNSFLMGVTDDFTSIDLSDMLVTDIATAQSYYLTLGTGYFDNIYVVIPYDGKLYLSRGSVYSFYEFTSDKRLTDEEWWAMQGINVVQEDWGTTTEWSEPSKGLPVQPDWIRSFKSDSNNVIISSLEVDWNNLQE